MFERYTEKSRRVIFFSRYEASQAGALAIEPEHILLGILREDKPLVNQFLAGSDISIESIRKEVERRISIRDRVSTSVDLPLSNEAKRVLTYAAEERENLHHRHVGPEHLLLGLLREKESIAAQILSEFGLSYEVVREKIKSPPREEQTAVPRVGLPADLPPAGLHIDIKSTMADWHLRVKKILDKIISDLIKKEIITSKEIDAEKESMLEVSLQLRALTNLLARKKIITPEEFLQLSLGENEPGEGENEAGEGEKQ